MGEKLTHTRGMRSGPIRSKCDSLDSDFPELTPLTAPLTYNKDGRFWPRPGQIGLKWDKSWTFSDQISLHFGYPSKHVLY